MPADKHVIDTNVLLVASAADVASPFAPDATPVEEAGLRRKVLEWLMAFEGSERRMVIDWGWVIVDEYKVPTDYLATPMKKIKPLPYYHGKRRF